MEDNKVLFRMMCINNSGFVSLYTEGKIYSVIEDKGVLMDDGRYSFESYSNFEELVRHSMIKWELVEETLLNKFYNLLGVENLEKFYLSDVSNEKMFMFDMGELKATSKGEYWSKSEMIYDILRGHSKIIKLPPKPIFSDEEKEQLKHIYGLFGECWVARDKKYKNLSVFKEKPIKADDYWKHESYIIDLRNYFLHFIGWQDTEPFEINQKLIESFKE